eukprot:9649249-Karenia_brevis.AAC.1
MLQKQLAKSQTGEKLFQTAAAEFKADFEEAAEAVGLNKFNLVTYQARHGGASRDALLKRR